MMVQVADDYGNITQEPLEIEVYAPIPQIRSISASGSLSGVLDSDIEGEPIHLFRVREGEGIRLISPDSRVTDDDGNFVFTDLFE
jgi:hypothetical protein